MGFAVPLLLLLLALARGSPADVVEGSPQEDISGAANDDECTVEAAGGSNGGSRGGECALSALQRRSHSLRIPDPEDDAPSAAGGVPPAAPDFEWRSGVDEIDGGAEEEGEGEDEDSNSADRGPWEEEEEEEEDEEAKPTTPQCHGPKATACPLGQTCVVKYDGTFSQCLDCSAHHFKKSCQKLGDYMRYAAVHTCKRTCLDTKCYNDHWCMKPYVCVTDQDSFWGQCVSCKSKKFWHNSCHSLSHPMLHTAQKRCHRHCRHR